jgi:hypothetical protein
MFRVNDMPVNILGKPSLLFRGKTWERMQKSTRRNVKKKREI